MILDVDALPPTRSFVSALRDHGPKYSRFRMIQGRINGIVVCMSKLRGVSNTHLQRGGEMSNMKFAIRKLAITCVLPTALWHGPMLSDAWAQNFPTATTKISAGMPQRRAVPSQKAPPAAKQQAPAANNLPQYPAAARGTVVGTSAPIYQVANPSAQQPQGGNDGGGGETDVQRQLRMLYEKSGQEMPAMDMSELSVPEPQPGVAPGSGDEEFEGGQQQSPQQQQQYAQPAVPPQKAPNFFERVFLGKKAPPPRPPMPPQRPLMPQTQARPGQPNGAQPGGAPANNYRPYQPGQPGQQVQPGQQAQPVQQGQPAPQLQLPQGYNGQRPNVTNQPGAVAQPNAGQQQPGPQLQLQRPGGQQVIPPQLPGQGQQQQQRPAGQQQQQQIQNPPQYNPQSSGGQQPVVQPQAPGRRDDVPFLDDEPEESMEFDLNSTSKPQGGSVPTDRPSGVIPAPAPASNSVANPGVAKPAVEPPAAPPEENPFSGLRLSLPETAVPAQAAPSAPAAGPTLTPGKSPAANAVLAPNATTTPAVNAAKPEEKDPFAFEDEPKEEVAKPVAQPTVKIISPPAFKPAETPTNPAAGKVAAPAVKPAATTTVKTTTVKATETSAVVKTASKMSVDERLKKLADATEKSGLKGFCPVALRQRGQLIETKLQFNAAYQGKKYHFSSSAAKAAFEKEPHLFAPVHDGLDGVALLEDEKSLPGSLDQALWYQGRLYLFANAENRDTFKNDPEGYVDDKELEETLTKAVSNPAKSAQPVPQQKAAAAAPADIEIKPAAKAAVKRAPLPDDLPVLSDNLDDLPSLTPVTSNTPEPSANGATARTPGLAPAESAKPGLSPRDAAPSETSPVIQQQASPPVVNPGSRQDLPLMKNATKNTPASFTVPQRQRTPPRLISPDLRLAPALNR